MKNSNSNLMSITKRKLRKIKRKHNLKELRLRKRQNGSKKGKDILKNNDK